MFCKQTWRLSCQHQPHTFLGSNLLRCFNTFPLPHSITPLLVIQPIQEDAFFQYLTPTPTRVISLGPCHHFGVYKNVDIDCWRFSQSLLSDTFFLCLEFRFELLLTLTFKKHCLFECAMTRDTPTRQCHSETCDCESTSSRSSEIGLLTGLNFINSQSIVKMECIE